MKNLRLFPDDQLEPGTRVSVIYKGFAKVVRCRIEKDQHGNPISVHDLEYEKTGKIEGCNYSFIYLPCV